MCLHARRTRRPVPRTQTPFAQRIENLLSRPALDEMAGSLHQFTHRPAGPALHRLDGPERLVPEGTARFEYVVFALRIGMVDALLGLVVVVANAVMK